MKKVICLGVIMILASGCTRSSTIDEQIEKYLESPKGKARIQEAVKKVLTESNQGQR